MNTYYVVYTDEAPGMKLFKVEASNDGRAVDQVLNYIGGWGETLVFSGAPIGDEDIDVDLTS